ncbi:MAG: response regulator [Acidobacteria bacterium]|nr:response regulator [Acidobacteriota bacterium]
MSTRVLVVDDTSLFRRVITDALTGIPGVEVAGSASNGKLALSRLASLQPDLMTLDLEMPEMGGLELYRRLRVAHPAVKLLFMTGHALAGGGYEELLQAGVPWLQKPFAVAALAARVRAALDGAPDF